MATGWAKRARNVLKKGERLRQARIRVLGHLNYYAITDNLGRCDTYAYHAMCILYKWLNRKSQRRAYTWAGFLQAVKKTEGRRKVSIISWLIDSMNPTNSIS